MNLIQIKNHTFENGPIEKGPPQQILEGQALGTKSKEKRTGRQQKKV